MTDTKIARPPLRKWTLFYSGLSGSGHIHSSNVNQSHTNDGDIYYDVVEARAFDSLLKAARELRDSGSDQSPLDFSIAVSKFDSVLKEMGIV